MNADPRLRPSADTASRVLDALRRSSIRARRVAAQTGTRLVVVREGKLVLESVVDVDAARAPEDPQR